MTSPTPAPYVAGEVPLCPSCLAAGGFCISCLHAIAPKLKRPSWVRLIGEKAKPREIDATAEKVRVRKWRKRMRRLGRALAGEFTRSRPAA